MARSINPSDLEHRLWNEIEKSPVGMLMMLTNPPMHAQPMAAFVEREARQMWFFASADSELGRAAADGGRLAMFVYQHKDFQACIGGQIFPQTDRERIDKYWNAIVAAWRPAGKNDPKLLLLCMECDDAQVWVSTANPVRFAWEIAKANATGHEPDVGTHTGLTFH